jgi:hypothetical protein
LAIRVWGRVTQSPIKNHSPRGTLSSNRPSSDLGHSIIQTRCVKSRFLDSSLVLPLLSSTTELVSAPSTSLLYYRTREYSQCHSHPQPLPPILCTCATGYNHAVAGFIDYWILYCTSNYIAVPSISCILFQIPSIPRHPFYCDIVFLLGSTTLLLAYFWLKNSL